MSKKDFLAYRDRAMSEVNTLATASAYQELLTRMEVEMQNLQDALINQDLDGALYILATEQNVGAIMSVKIESDLNPKEISSAPVLECPYCLREIQSQEDATRGYILPAHGMRTHTDLAGNPAPNDPDCPNSFRAPAEFLVKE